MTVAPTKGSLSWFPVCAPCFGSLSWFPVFDPYTGLLFSIPRLSSLLWFSLSSIHVLVPRLCCLQSLQVGSSRGRTSDPHTPEWLTIKKASEQTNVCKARLVKISSLSASMAQFLSQKLRKNYPVEPHSCAAK